MSQVSDLDEAEIVDLLGRDVVATLGAGHLDMVRATARQVRGFTDDRAWYRLKVVEDVQQYVHDCFIDTVWPACPEHPNHPMWLEEGWWVAHGRRVAQLGGLGQVLKRTAV